MVRLCRQSKNPVDRDGTLVLSTCWDEVRLWFTAGDTSYGVLCGVPLTTDPNRKLVGFDHDTYKPAAQPFDWPPTLRQASASGGTHHVYTTPVGCKLACNGVPALDVKGGDGRGYLVGFGSQVRGKNGTVGYHRPAGDEPLRPLPAELAARFAANGAQTPSAGSNTLPERDWPPAVVDALGRRTADRSADLHNLVGVCFRAGLDTAQIHTVAAGYPPAVDKYGGRLAGEVTRSLHRIAKEDAASPPHGQRATDELYELAGLPPPADVDPTTGQIRDSWPAGVTLDELGVARQLVHRHGHQIRHVGTWSRWLVWDGRRWATDDTGQVTRWAKQTTDALRGAATTITDAKQRQEALRFCQRARSRTGLAGIVGLAATEPGVAVHHDQLDTHPWLLNVDNGVLDLRTGELADHDPALLLTKVTRAAYYPDATSAEFDAFLARIQPDAGMRGYLARLFGHSLVGQFIEHVLPIFHGVGANGKGTLVELILHTLGDYAIAGAPELLLADPHGHRAHPTDQADLFGMRLVALSESDEGRRLAEGTAKRLTGGDTVRARRMHQDFWEFTPSHTFVYATNHRPEVRGTDDGIWRRLRCVPFDVHIPADEQDGELGARLQRQAADAVLTWLVDGCQSWQQYGLDDPKQVLLATSEYRTDADPFARFLDQRCLVGPAWTVGASELFTVWRHWCATEGIDAGTQTRFGRELDRRGYPADQVASGHRVRKGLTLAAEGDDRP